LGKSAIRPKSPAVQRFQSIPPAKEAYNPAQSFSP
jgi:hypothetical protein